MRKIKEILRLRYELKRTHREIANSVHLSTSTISECVKRAKEAGLSWPLPDNLDEEMLEDMLYRKSRRIAPKHKEIDFVKVNQELKRKNMTLYLLWYEYKEQRPDGLGYSRFCDVYRAWKQTIDVTMRQNYKFG